MESFDIKTYLRDFNGVKKVGICISCEKSIPWNRERVGQHKRSSCLTATPEERKFFAKRKSDGAGDMPEHDDSSVPERNSKETIDTAVANFFYRTGIAFKVADSGAFKSMLQTLNPDYSKEAPSAKVLGGRLLEGQYQSSKIKLKNLLDSAERLTLTSDGWTNIRGDHLVNFIVRAPDHTSFFYKAIDTTGIPQTAIAVANEIIKVIEEIGADKFSAVVTDNANVMQAAWTIIEQRFPTIAAYGCSAHGVNLLIKDIISKIPEHTQTMADVVKIAKFINNHHISSAKFQDKMKESAVTHKLTSPVSTRWYSSYTAAFNLREAKVLIMRLAHEDYEALSAILPKANSESALKCMKLPSFWNRLDKLIKDIEVPSKVIGKLGKLCKISFELDKVLFIFKVNSKLTTPR